jgi:ribosomal subunit interface protein
MQIQTFFKHFDHTYGLDQMIGEKSKKLEKWLSSSAKVNWRCWIESDEQICSIEAHDKGKDFFAKATSGDLYKSIESALEKITHQFQHSQR